jgi:guanine deaminase
LRRAAFADTVAIIEERALLLRAIELGTEGMRAGRGGPFGAVVVRDGRIIGEGANSVIRTNDPTAHAEVVAIRAAASSVQSFSLAGSVIYASSEPCPMCLAAILWARIDRVVYASDRGVAARGGFDDAVFYDELARPPHARTVPLVHRPMPEGEALFDEWIAKPDKVPY